MLAEEEPVADAARRSVRAARDLAEGAVITVGDLTWLRPREGLPVSASASLIGRQLRVARAFGDPIEPADLN